MSCFPRDETNMIGHVNLNHRFSEGIIRKFMNELYLAPISYNS